MTFSTKNIGVCIFFFVFLMITGLQAQENPYIKKAESLQQQGNYQGALLEYENAINHNPVNYQLWLKQGNIYTILKDWSNASRTLEKVIELKKDYLEGYIALRKIYVQSQKTDKAILVLDKAFQNDQDLKRKISYKIDIIKMLDAKQKLSEANQHIQDAKQVNATHPEILFYEAKYHNQTEAYQQAIESATQGLNALTSSNPQQTSRFYYQIGYAHHQLEDYQNARANLSKANFGDYKSKVFKMTHIYHYRIAKAYFEAQNYEKSAEFLEITLKMNPNYKNAKVLEKQLTKVRDTNMMLVDSLKTLASSQKHPVAKSQTLVKLAELYYSEKNYENALSTITEALTLSENLDAEFLKAMAYYQTGNYQKSAETVSQLMQLKHFRAQEDKAVYFFMMGQAYEKAHNQEEALKQYHKAKFGDFKYAVMERLDEIEKQTKRM